MPSAIYLIHKILLGAKCSVHESLPSARNSVHVSLLNAKYLGNESLLSARNILYFYIEVAEDMYFMKGPEHSRNV